MSPYGILESKPYFRLVRCFFTGLAISQILPFLPLYISQLGVTSHEALSMWSGLTFSVTFLISAIVSPMWGSLADRKGRKLMLLRASLGMAIAILLQAFATNVWQLFLLRGVMGLTSGYIPNAMALVASQVPRERSRMGIEHAFYSANQRRYWRSVNGRFYCRPYWLTGGVLYYCCFVGGQFPCHAVFDQRGCAPDDQKRTPEREGRLCLVALSGAGDQPVFDDDGDSVCVTALSGQFWRCLSNQWCQTVLILPFPSGLIASVPGISALISAPRLGKLGDRIGTERILMATLMFAVVLFAMSWVTTPLQLGVLRFLLGFADGAMLPAVQTLLVKYSSDQITGRIFGYNQSFMYPGNVAVGH